MIVGEKFYCNCHAVFRELVDKSTGTIKNLKVAIREFNERTKEKIAKIVE